MTIYTAIALHHKLSFTFKFLIMYNYLLRIFNLLLIAIALFISSLCSAQSGIPSQEPTHKNQFSVLFGLNQPIVLNGFNFELNYWTKKWVIDYSHGIGLNVDGNTLGSEYEDQKINFKITHSAGIGFGYRFTESFNVRIEPKIHVYETYYEGDNQTKENSIANFTTYTLGLGAYYRWMPFENKTNALKGITVSPSIRYWYKVGSTMDNNKLAYFNTKTNKEETLEAPNIGIANTPIIVNISIGYTF